MKTDETSHVILEKAYGRGSAYACTVANAMAILEQESQNLDPDVAALTHVLRQSPKTTCLYPAADVADALNELLKASEGVPLRKLRRVNFGPAPKEGTDTRPELLATKKDQDEVALWLFHAKKREVSAGLVMETSPEEALECLKPFAARWDLPLQYVRDAVVLTTAREWNVIQEGRWKEDVLESRVVRRILAFVSENLKGRDTEYDVVEIQAKV